MTARVLHLVPRQPIPHPSPLPPMSETGVLVARCMRLRADLDLALDEIRRLENMLPRTQWGRVVLAAIAGFMVAVLMRGLGW